MNIKNTIIAFLLSLLAVQYSFAQPLAAGLQTLTVDGRSVDVRTPAAYNPAAPLPVLFFLHGLGGDKNSFQVPGVDVATLFNIIAVFPEGTSVSTGGRMWNSFSNSGLPTNNTNDVAFLNSVYATLQSRIGAAFVPAQVFGLGFSNGASMLLKMNKNSNIFKALVLGSMSEEQGANGVIPATASKVPMLFMQGMSDAVVPFQGGQGSYGPLATFEDLRTAVGRWAVHNQCDTTKMQFTFAGNASISPYHFREYRKNQTTGASIFLYMVPNADHAFGGVNGFTPQNIFTTAMRFFATPSCYGFSKDVCNY